MNEFASPYLQPHTDQTAAMLPIEEAGEDLAEDLESGESQEDVAPESYRKVDLDARPREGLPSGFRMRHDAHYVDELISRGPTDAGPAASDRTVRQDRTPETPPAFLAAIAMELTERLEMVAAHARVVTDSPASMTALSADLLHVELGRATRIARAAALMTGIPTLSRREVSTRAILDRACEDTAVARRLAGVSLEVKLEDPDFQVPVDPGLVNHALTSTLEIMLACVSPSQRGRTAGDRRGGGLAVAIDVQCPRIRPAMVIEVSQRVASLDPSVLSQFLDADSNASQHLDSSGLLLAACARVVRAHGGRVDVRDHGSVGCALALVFPQFTGRGAAG